MNDFREIKKEPTFLTRRGYVRRDEETADCVRSVWYEKKLQSDSTQLCLVIQIEFEETIYEGATTVSDKYIYSFRGVFLQAIDRQMDFVGQDAYGRYYDEDSERPNEIDRYELNLRTLSRLRAFESFFSQGV